MANSKPKSHYEYKLGTLYRFQPIPSANFVKKQVSITDEGVAYYKNEHTSHP